ncbi:hypothetical protein [Streptomyces sp. NPDC051286]|uniref:hypothetical protein n=1 Tax=Streptomyces sp. NPDC051286 TaxID=3365647 RepID=UPI00378D0732
MNELHRRAVVADLHNDLLCAVVARPVDHWAGYFRERWLPQLRAGGVNLQALPVRLSGPPFRPTSAALSTGVARISITARASPS